MVVAENSPPLPALVIDGSSSRFFAGVLKTETQWSANISSKQAPLESLFPTVKTVLEEAGLNLDEVQTYIYCEGPGSVLGLRLCAMAMETWSRLHHPPADFYAYNSLQLTAASIIQEHAPDSDALLISDWKKEAWNSLLIHDGQIGTVKPIKTGRVQTWNGPLYHLPARKGWQQSPEGAVPTSYRPEQLAQLLSLYNLLRKTPSVELYSSGINTFQKWTPERHRATSV